MVGAKILQEFQTHRGRFNRTELRRADLHPHRCLLTDVVPEALSEEPGLQPSLGPSPGVAVKFVFQNLSFLIVQIYYLLSVDP
ncbi:hypothetical protein MTP99_018770 [Tenebrio molitor]|jgi:hypothetical protein|nr:hypothetical protein MTP99_018770 [Tenebrio molitor]